MGPVNNERIKIWNQERNFLHFLQNFTPTWKRKIPVGPANNERIKMWDQERNFLH